MKRSELIEDIASELVRDELNFPKWSICLIIAEYIVERLEKDERLNQLPYDSEDSY